MFDKAKVTNSFSGLVGFKNPSNPAFAIVDIDNQTSRSGRYATENPYCKIESLKETQDYIEASDADFNLFLKELQSKSVSEVMDKVLLDSDYIDRQILYQFANNKVQTEDLITDSFVGYRINKSLEKNVAFELTRIFLEFSGTGDIELLLFNSAVKDPIFSKVVSITKPQQVEILNWRIDDTLDSFQGEWYLGYLTSGLTVLPFKREYQRAGVKSSITHLCFNSVDVKNVTANELFDLDDVNSSSNCWGLNPDVFVFSDYSNLLINSEHIFAPAIQLQIVINAVQIYITSLRSNRTEQISSEQLNFIIAQLEGVPDRIIGLIPTLRKEVESLNTQINRLVNGYYSNGFELNTLS